MFRSRGAMAHAVARSNTPAVLRHTVLAGATAVVVLAVAAPGLGRSAAHAAATCDGLSGTGGSITNGAHDITIRNSTFTTHATFDALANANIVFDHNTHNNINSPSGAPNARLGFYWGSSTPSGVTIKNSTMNGGDSDGIHTGVAVNVLNNTLTNICDQGGNHTDNIQFEGANGGRIAGNHISATCTTQGITSYDGATNAVTIEDNVIDIRRAWGIEFYADKNSTIRHNTVRYYAPGCYGASACGYIALDRKPEDPAGSGTQVYDNIGMIAIGNGSTASRNDHNQNGSTVKYQGPTDRWTGFKLTADSAGKNGASDGLDLGARIG
jgi:Right handed beta helix region